MRLIQATGVAFAVAALAAPALAGDVTIGKRSFGSLQAALDGAQDGDRIVVRGEVARIAVLTHEVDRLTLDLRRAHVRRNVFLMGDGHRIRGGTFDGARLTVRGNGTRVLRAEFANAFLTPLHLEGARVRVRGCRVDAHAGATPGFSIRGDDARVDRNTIHCHGTEGVQAFRIDGNGAQVRQNRVSASTVAPMIVGDDARIERNFFSTRSGPQVTGDRAVFRRNSAEWLDSVVEIRGDDARIDANLVIDLVQDGVAVTGDDTVVRRNRIRGRNGAFMKTDTSESALVSVDGDRARIERNDLHRNFVDAERVGNIDRHVPGVGAAMDAGLTVAEAFPPLGTGVWIRGHDAVATSNDLSGHAVGVGVRGNGATVERNRTDHVDASVDVVGGDAEICRNVSTRAYVAVNLVGDDFLVERNRSDVGRLTVQLTEEVRMMRSAESGGLTEVSVAVPDGDPIQIVECPAIVVHGADGAVTGNHVDHTLGGAGVTLDVTGTDVTNNTIRGVDTGTTSLGITGSGNTITQNTVTSFGNTGVQITGGTNVISGNTLATGAGQGLVATGDENLLDGNVVTGAGRDAICVEGNGTTLRDNDVTRSAADGIVIDGNDHVLTGNTVSRVPGDGFCLASGSGIVVTDCTAVRCGNDGLENRALDVSVTQSQFGGAVWDVNNRGTFGAFDGNRFESLNQ